MRSLYGSVIALALVLCAATDARAQAMHLEGQNVQPVFEGWQRNADGTYSLFFGYLNRNYEEEPNILVGPNNAFEPGPADRGQPTHFYTRRQQFVFSVVVPADFGKKELVWTMTHHGRTSTAVGSLMPVWEIDEGVWKANRGSGIRGRTSKDVPVNNPPTVTVAGGTTFTVTLPEALTLTASASDDGLPGARKPTPPPQRADGAPRSEASALPIPQSSVPTRTRQDGPTTQDKVLAKLAYDTGLAVTWLHYRGPGKVTFEPMSSGIKPEGSGLSGKVTTTARFSEPGTYVLRVVGDDGHFTNGTNVTVVVKASSSLSSQLR